MKITLVAGARPNFMKIAPIIDAFEEKIASGHHLSYRLVHTGQHYDKNLSGSFFEELGIPLPDANLDVRSGTQAEQTANIMVGFEQELINNPADLVIVVGDVNSTMACAIVAKKLCIKVAHVEAGIRSGDLSMPEEINRMVTDSITDYFFTTSRLANTNLIKLGVLEKNIYFVGNVMIDTLLKNKSRFNKPACWNELNLEAKNYFVLTMHRPSNVDQEMQLKSLLNAVAEYSKGLPIVFPVHPRTKAQLEKLTIDIDNLYMVSPLSYLKFNYLVENAFAVLTDSGGITEETTILKVPCITLRENTERPETITIGTNRLVGHDNELLRNAFEDLFNNNWPSGEAPELWDGKAASRIVDSLTSIDLS